ncbi:hypothetical protein D3C83_59610 [compost metagenome]
MELGLAVEHVELIFVASRDQSLDDELGSRVRAALGSREKHFRAATHRYAALEQEGTERSRCGRATLPSHRPHYSISRPSLPS